ncbi:energy-coupling factor transporter ATPase [Carboxydochorda subterranea]|uniref:Energy-coupling factor transporter ATPase n=1 Tax=Carboxydichorda subterranea TaxID=3109565 RepID=A0ABZ1BYF8_9FIRM|nr:energy-coupling factor transporter ATPase [Limnochorda sp. L945t]WRP17744.1 energy-coupling factor transporter ATPase [Limnochorda sp. L945t]
MADALLDVQEVSFSYAAGGATPAVGALSGVSLRVRRGEFVAIVGPNGSGKSTLARHLNGLLVPQQGRVLVDGMDTRDPAAVWEIRRRVGMVFQNPDNQLVATTVEEDVAFGPENLGIAHPELGQRVEWALDVVGMSAFRRHAPHRLSGGQKQRVAIAGVLAMRPSCIVLDEPTSMLDPEGQQEVMDALVELRRKLGVAVVLITHRMREAALADRVVVMHQGRILHEGSPGAVFQQADLLRRLGLDLPPAIALAERLRRLGVDVPAAILTPRELVEWLCSPSSVSAT